MAALQRFKRSEVAERSARTKFIIDNLVYDVTKFLEDHPGGHEVLVDAAGSDASQRFRDVDHSREAKALMRDYLVGELVDEDKTVAGTKSAASGVNKTEDNFLVSWQFSLMLAVIFTAIHLYVFGLGI